MYDASSIIAGFSGEVGWRQNVDITGLQLTSLTTSTSGLYFNDEHPLLTLQNLIRIAPEYDKLNDATGDNQESRFSEWLNQKTNAALIRALNRWTGEKSKIRTAKSLLAHNVVFKNTSTTTSQDENKSKIVGHTINIVPSQSVRTTINSIALQLTQSQTLTVSLYETGQAVAIQSEAFVYSGAGSVQWFTPSSTWQIEGNKTYFIAYDQTTLTGVSINSIYGQTSEFSNDCAKYTRFTSFETESLTAEELAGDKATGNGTNYGLNYKVSVKCDYTDFILSQKSLFKTIWSKQVAIDLLRELAYNANTRENRNASNIDYNQIMYEIEGDSTGTKQSGLEMELSRAIDSIQFDYTNIDSICLPCKKRGVIYRSV